MVYIYTLSSSETPTEIRYIGKAKNLKDRLRRHVSSYSLNKEINYKNNWIKSELAKGNTILINEIDCVEESIWVESETYYIGKYKELGYKLTNSTIGGEGILLTEEVIKKRNESNRNSEKRKQYNKEKGILSLEENIKKYKINKVDNLLMAYRNCPNCGKIIEYSSEKIKSVINSIKRANTENRECFSCSNGCKNNYFYGKKLNDGKEKQEKYGKKILQCDKEGNILNEYASIREANEKTGIDRKSISNCAKKVKSFNTAGGFIFKFKEN